MFHCSNLQVLTIRCLYVCTKESVCSTVYTVMGKHVHTTCMYYGMALTLLPRQCGGSGSAVAVGSSMLQGVAKHARTVSRSHTPFLPPFVDCASQQESVEGREWSDYVRLILGWIKCQMYVYLSVYRQRKVGS